MQDRVSLYPGRVKLDPVAGQANLYDLTRADQPTQDGTPLNKESLLKDTTAELFGLDANAVPDDAFNVLSRFQKGLGNEYVWEKSKETINIYQADELLSVYLTNRDSYPISYIRYSDAVEVDDSGNIVLSAPITEVTVTTTYNDYTNKTWPGPNLDGKYIQYSNTSLTDAASKTVVVGSSISYVDGAGGYFQLLYYAVLWKTVTTSYGYVNSPDPNAYPPAVSDGYTYTALGQLGAKVQIEAGSYVGNGNIGVDNPNVVTLGFEAKLFMLTRTYYNDANQANLLNVKYYSTIVPFSLLPTSYKNNYGPCGVSNLANCYTKRDGNTLYWYVTSGDQFNNAGWTYNYLAIG